MTPIEALYSQAVKHPDHLAFISGNDDWSYHRLTIEVDRLAGALLARGIRSGDRIALHMTNRPELVAAYHACFRIGAIAAPLNLRYKTAELRTLLRRLQPALFLGEGQLYREVAPIEPDILAPSARVIVGTSEDGQARPWESLFEAEARSPVIPDPDLDAPAVLLTTSGTTGEPKFVPHTLATLSAITEILRQNRFAADEVGINALPMVHAAGLVMCLDCIRHGSPMVLLERFDADAVLDAVARHRCNWMPGLPFMFAEMAMRQKARRRDVASLQFCLCGGDVCPAELQQQFPEVFGIPLRSTWGSTEMGLFLYGLQPGPVTRIPPGVEVRLADDNGAPVPRGSVGEMLIRGPIVTPGYWTGPGRIDDPRTDGWFPTGDLMKRGAGDELWFFSRKKDLIIRGGSNISPVEIERVLRGHAAVRDAAVVGTPDPILGQRVAALVQLVGDAGADVDKDILADAKTKLADYKVPERLKIVTQIPKNASGKVDRKSALAMMAES
jgi:long-chain acyl-CoA synthetase